MQTFLPYPDFKRSLDCLDYQRLGRQRSEARQIIRWIKDTTGNSRNHPVYHMWKSYLPAIQLYYNTCLESWLGRDYKNNMEFEELDVSTVVYPHWLGDEAFHAAHRSNLLRKKPEWYGKFGWKESPDLPYIWPK